MPRPRRKRHGPRTRGPRPSARRPGSRRDRQPPEHPEPRSLSRASWPTGGTTSCTRHGRADCSRHPSKTPTLAVARAPPPHKLVRTALAVFVPLRDPMVAPHPPDHHAGRPARARGQPAHPHCCTRRSPRQSRPSLKRCARSRTRHRWSPELQSAARRRCLRCRHPHPTTVCDSAAVA